MTFEGAWAPDDSRFAVTLVPDESGRSVLIVDAALPPDEYAPRWLPPPGPSLVGCNVSDWSPDGARLAGMTAVTDDGILVLTLDSGVYEHLTPVGQWPVWLPDSRRILLVSGGRAFYVADAETREVRDIFSVTDAVLGPPRVGRDGQAVVYSRRVAEADIWVHSLQ